MEEVTIKLGALIKERGETYSSISRLLGRNAAYIQQFIQRGSPRRLDDDDIAVLARHFEVAPSVLGGIDQPPCGPGDVVLLPILNAKTEESVRAFDARLLQRAGVKHSQASVVQIDDDAMQPTLSAGDEAIFHRLGGTEALRDGLYALRIDGAMVVRRIALEPVPGRVTVSCDHAHYPRWPGVTRRSLTILGRVCWIGRMLG
ncbi:S24 family peptidase [Novosphingobium sp.]|uniref:S24 family peptidase n=1 Tax=Novosphingobium sp. TaxID=1874826 RepID=UPI001D9F2EF5|nr:S24 family peptidase [Novosphingobium sp.]MBX9662131.1 S24 family peptidase [Novosphingobium sp.]